MSTAAILDAAGVVINIVVAEHLEISGSVDGSDAAIGDTWDGARFVRPGSNEQPPEPIPTEVPRWQCIRALRLTSDPNAPARTCLDTVMAIRDAMQPGNLRDDVDDALQNVLNWRRISPTLDAMAMYAGWSPEFVNTLFKEAGNYEL